MRLYNNTFDLLGPLVRELGRDALVPTPLADPFLYLAVPPEAVVGPAVLFRGSFRPDAALAPSFALAALLYWLLALALLFFVGLRGRRGLVAAHSFFLSSDARSDAVLRRCGSMLGVAVRAARTQRLKVAVIAVIAASCTSNAVRRSS